MSAGLLFVESKILPESGVSDDAYNSFYNNEHIPDVLKSGIQSSSSVALRYKNANAQAEFPYLALYQVSDHSTLWNQAESRMSDDFMKLAAATQTSATGPLAGADVQKVAVFKPRMYEKVQTFETSDSPAREIGNTVIAVGMEPGDEEDFDEWYRKQHLDMLSMCKGYRRCTRYRRLDVQKGDESGAPRFLALHEYACTPEEVPADQLKKVSGQFST